MVIDDQFAKLYFAGKDPMGKHVNLGIVNMSAEVVAVVGHVKQWGLENDPLVQSRRKVILQSRNSPTPFFRFSSTALPPSFGRRVRRLL